MILGDYEAVIPLPWNSKIPGYQQVYQPLFCQQLGLFTHHKEEFSLYNVLGIVRKRFRLIQLRVHKGNLIEHVNFKDKTNLELTLNLPYEQIVEGYHKSLRKRLNKTAKLVVNESTTVGEVISYYRRHVGSKTSLKDRDFNAAGVLFEEIHQRGLLDLYRVEQDGVVVTQGLFIVFKGRIINVMAASNLQGRDGYAMHFLIDHVIQKYAGRAAIFDFEGSEIPGVKAFFESFGSENVPYAELNLNSLSRPANWMLNAARGLRNQLV